MVAERICTRIPFCYICCTYTPSRLLSFFFQLAPIASLQISGPVPSRPRQQIPTTHKPQARNRQRNANRHVQPPILANHKGHLAVNALGGAEEAHAEDAADEGGWEEKHREDLDDSQSSAVLMGGASDLGGFGGHFDVHLEGGVSGVCWIGKGSVHKPLRRVDSPLQSLH